MLIDINLINPYGEKGEEFIPKHLRTGMYADWYMIEDMSEFELLPYHHLDELKAPSLCESMDRMISWLDSPEYIPDYGMCDDDEQFLRRFPHIVSCEQKYIITFSLIDKASEPETGGFRFHKNGQYYGEQQCEGYEYFAHEPHMTHVCAFHVYRVTDKPNPNLNNK